MLLLLLRVQILIQFLRNYLCEPTNTDFLRKLYMPLLPRGPPNIFGGPADLELAAVAMSIQDCPCGLPLAFTVRRD